jgi:hypothetical protein
MGTREQGGSGRPIGGRGGVVLALAAIAAIAAVAPALGGPSLKKLVKKEVAKQIRKATGPAGANGLNGVNGLNGANGAPGADGTARAHARVISHATAACTGGCTFDLVKGVTSVTHPGLGSYCVAAPGISKDTTPAAVTVDANSAAPAGNATALTTQSFIGCGAAEFGVLTYRRATGADAVLADDVSFTIVIP